MRMTKDCNHQLGKREDGTSRQRGFTLIELTLAISVLAVMVMLNYKTLRGLIEAKLLLDDKRDGMYIANSLLTRMARELQLILPSSGSTGAIIPACDTLGPAAVGGAAPPVAPPPGPRIFFQAESDGIGSSARARKMVFVAEEAGQYIFDGGTRSGIVQITYRIEEDPDNRGLSAKTFLLVRDEIPYRSDPRKACAGLITFPIAKNVSKMELRFLDQRTKTWSSEWGADKAGRIPDVIEFSLTLLTPQGTTESFTTAVAVR